MQAGGRGALFPGAWQGRDRVIGLLAPAAGFLLVVLAGLGSAWGGGDGGAVVLRFWGRCRFFFGLTGQDKDSRRGAEAQRKGGKG